MNTHSPTHSLAYLKALYSLQGNMGMPIAVSVSNKWFLIQDYWAANSDLHCNYGLVRAIQYAAIAT